MNTPRTDAEVESMADRSLDVFEREDELKDFARQLERELEEANRKLSNLKNENAGLLDSVDLLRDEVLQANAEIERSAVYQRLREIHQETVDQLTAAKSALEKARDELSLGGLTGESSPALKAINEVLKEEKK